MLTGFFGFLLKLATGGFVDKVLNSMERRAENETEREKVRTQASVETIREAVKESAVLADFNKTKISFPWFWIFASLFILPLAAWWTMVILDSIFYFPFDIADLPTPEMRSWAGDMIKWLFFVGSGVGALKAILPK